MRIDRIIVLCLLMAFSLNGIAQHNLFNRDTDDWNTLDKKGPNMSRYTNTYISFGFSPEISVSEPLLRYPALNDLNIGWKEKFKINKYLAVGLSFYYHQMNYPLKQFQGKIFPDTLIYHRQNVVIAAPGTEAWFRINFNKRRGNFTGTFLDMGGKAEWNMHTKIKNVSFEGKERITESITKLTFTEPLSFYAVARMGHNFFAVTASWRLANLFKPEYNYPELPAFIFGIEFNTSF